MSKILGVIVFLMILWIIYLNIALRQAENITSEAIEVVRRALFVIYDYRQANNELLAENGKCEYILKGLFRGVEQPKAENVPRGTFKQGKTNENSVITD